jgi:hypothetical protein
MKVLLTPPWLLRPGTVLFAHPLSIGAMSCSIISVANQQRDLYAILQSQLAQ